MEVLETTQAVSPKVMGIVNITHNSFYDGERYLDPQHAVSHAKQLIAEGADILDIGAEASNPGSVPLDINLEYERIVTFFESFAKEKNHIPISVDTSRSRVAQKAIELGATIINDIYALRRDPELVDVLQGTPTQIVLMHMQGTPQTMQKAPSYTDVVSEVLQFFEERIHWALRHGLQEAQIVLDPGIGFGKTFEHNMTLLKNIPRLKSLGFPLLVGPSRKAFIGHLLNHPPEHRLFGTAAVVAYLTFSSVDWIRVHDVNAMKDVVTMSHTLATTPLTEKGGAA